MKYVYRGRQRLEHTGLVGHAKNFLNPKSNWFQTEIPESDSVGFSDSKSNKENRLKRDKSRC